VGLKGMLAPGFGFKASIYRNSVKDMPLFVSNFDLTKNYNKFSVIYDNGKSRVSGFNGELDYKPSADFDLFGRIELKDYQMATEAKAWNLPSLKLTAGTVIHISKLINVNGTLDFNGNRYDRLNNGQEMKLASFADLSGGIEYKATQKLSIFVQVNNLLSNNYQSWLYYPNYGFNIFGGVGYRF
jgi:outer membrane cobalamin receptor